MILAAVVLASLFTALVVALAVRAQRCPAPAGILLAAAVPLAGWLFMQLASEPARSPVRFEVLGQYHRLSDTVRVAARQDADVVLSEPGAADADILLSFDASTSRINVVVERSRVPVILGDRPVNARSLRRRSTIRSAQGDSVVVARPFLCVRCDTRYVWQDGQRTEVRLDRTPAIALGTDTVRLFRIGGDAWVGADPGADVRVDDVAIPAALAGAADSLFVGWPRGARLDIVPVPAQHRLDIRFGTADRARWVLPRAVDDTLTMLVSATTAAPLPGTMPVLNPAAVAPGAAREPYGGMLALRSGTWTYSADGVTRAFATDVPELLPGAARDRAAGHIVQIRHYDLDPARARWAVIIAWLMGAGALAWLWRHLHPEAIAARIGLLGAVYTLVAVRGILAFRAWLAPPHDASSPRTFIALLLAIPALTAVLHLWARAADSGRDAHLRRELATTAAPLLLAAAAVGALVLPDWRAAVFQTVAAAVLFGAAGLALLNRLLLGRSSGAAPRHPLAAASAPAVEGYTYRNFVAALLFLAVLGFLLIVIMQLLRYGTLLAFAGWGVILGIALLTVADPGVVIRRPSSSRRVSAAVLAGLASAAVAWVLQLGLVITVAAFAAAAAVAWVLVQDSGFRVRPVRIRALLGPPLFIAVAASLAAVLFPDAIGAMRVTAEYALALGGLIAITRIFSILWFRHTHRLTRGARARRGQPLPGGYAVGAVIVLLVAAVYAPLAVFDQGLVLLFLAATVAAVAVGFHTMGARLLAAVVPAAVVIVFFLGMYVPVSRIADGSAGLSTARTRYAATYHPRELQRHMLASDDARPVTAVRTLQQYWGIGYFAAGGTAGAGYFGSAYADWIVPRPVALTENVFSTFVLSEHGWAGGAAVLLCYLSIALALLYGALRTTERSASAPRALLFAGLAAFWLVPALYIAAANGLLLPLTGQNMPMLGLLSRADVALACWLAAIGLTAMPAAGSSGLDHVTSGGWVGRMRTATVASAGIFATATLALIALLWSPTHAEVGDFALDGVIDDVEALVDQAVIHVAHTTDGPDSLVIAPSAAAHPLLRPGGFVRSRVARANALARGETPGAGCLDADALLRPRDDGTVAVFNALCSIRAAPRSSHAWAGSLVVAQREPSFVLTDGRAAVVLDPLAAGDAVLGPCTRAGTRRARAVRLGCGPDAPVLRFGTSAPILESVGEAGVELNRTAAQSPTLIRHGDHLRVAGGADAWALSLPPGALSYARWENADSRRIAAAPGTWLAQVDTQLARGLASEQRGAWDAEVTLDEDLHAALQARVLDACAAIARVRRCSVLVADPLTGAILAFAASAAQPHRYLPSDPNLRNHPAASAIKPILAAAALHAYPALRTLEVEHAAGEYDVIANTAVQPSLRAPRSYPAARIPLRGYLGASDNLYSATLGFLATSSRADDRMPALRGQSDQSRLVLNGRPLRGQPTWSGSGTLDLADSPLANALHELYGAHVRSIDAPPFDREFWEPAVRADALVASADLQRITPEPVGLRMDTFRSPRELTSFTIGGDRNRWNNVALVEAMSRIYTGRAVRLHLLAAAGPTRFDYTAAPIPGFAARTEVLDGMAAVTQEPWGTAYALRNAFAPALTWRAKTGTLREREWVGSLFLFAGGDESRQAGTCAAAGVVTIEFAGDVNPDGAATALFRDAIAPLLREHMGWDGTGCS